MPYVFKTLDLRNIFLSGNLDKSVLLEIPLYSNYRFDCDAHKVGDIYGTLSTSSSRIINHLDVTNLTTSCYIELTESQAKKFGVCKHTINPFYSIEKN